MVWTAMDHGGKEGEQDQDGHDGQDQEQRKGKGSEQGKQEV
jgi:hypothetical protein